MLTLKDITDMMPAAHLAHLRSGIRSLLEQADYHYKARIHRQMNNSSLLEIELSGLSVNQPKQPVRIFLKRICTLSLDTIQQQLDAFDIQLEPLPEALKDYQPLLPVYYRSLYSPEASLLVDRLDACIKQPSAEHFFAAALLLEPQAYPLEYKLNSHTCFLSANTPLWAACQLLNQTTQHRSTQFLEHELVQQLLQSVPFRPDAKDLKLDWMAHMTYLGIPVLSDQPGLIRYIEPRQREGQSSYRCIDLAPGKYFRRKFPDATDEAVKDFANAFKNQFAMTLHQCRGSADDAVEVFERVYTTGPSSCMSHKTNTFRTGGVHPTAAYCHPQTDITLFWVEDIEGQVVARTLGRQITQMYVSQVYCKEGRLHARRFLEAQLQEQGFASSRTALAGGLMSCIDAPDGGYVLPYIDEGNPGVDLDEDGQGFRVALSEGSYCCEHRTGTTQCLPTCDDCDDEVDDEDDLTTVERGDQVCRHCLNEHYVEATISPRGSEGWISRDDATHIEAADVWVADDLSDEAISDLFDVVRCQASGNWILQDDAVELADGGQIHQNQLGQGYQRAVNGSVYAATQLEYSEHLQGWMPTEVMDEEDHGELDGHHYIRHPLDKQWLRAECLTEYLGVSEVADAQPHAA